MTIQYCLSRLGFSRPKPVFPVQNGINWDKLVFPSFPVHNWEILSKTGKTHNQILWTQIFAMILLLIQLVLTFPHNENHVQNCDLILSTSKMCKIWLQAADYKITSPVLCSIVFWTLYIPSGTRIGQNSLQMAEHSAWMLRFWVENPQSGIFLSQNAISQEHPFISWKWITLPHEHFEC